jgi:hypothetical protein
MMFYNLQRSSRDIKWYYLLSSTTRESLKKQNGTAKTVHFLLKFQYHPYEHDQKMATINDSGGTSALVSNSNLDLRKRELYHVHIH